MKGNNRKIRIIERNTEELHKMIGNCVIVGIPCSASEVTNVICVVYDDYNSL